MCRTFFRNSELDLEHQLDQLIFGNATVSNEQLFNTDDPMQSMATYLNDRCAHHLNVGSIFTATG